MDYEDNNAQDCPVEQFSNFNFGQSVAKILDNMGFSATTADALEMLTSMMRRYFEDLCQRIVVNKEHGKRELPSLGDINLAFKAQNVSLLELNDYMHQVQKLPAPFLMPQYPVQQFSENEIEKFQAHIFNANPFLEEVPSIEEIEEKYGKKEEVVEDKIMEEVKETKEVIEEVGVNKTSVVIEEDPKEKFNSWKISDDIDFVDFSGKSATDLGFDMNLYRRKFIEIDNKQPKIGFKTSTNYETPKLFERFDRFVPQSSTMSVSQKRDGLNSLVEKIKKHKEKKKDKNKDKERKKDKERSHEKKKHKKDIPFLPAPTLTPAIPIPDPDSGLGDSFKLPSMTNKEANIEFVKMKPLEPIVSIPEPIKVDIHPITPPPTLVQITPIPTISTISDCIPKTTSQLPTQSSVTTELPKEDELKKEKSKKHKKKHKKNREKDENRKRKHDQISTTLPPVLEPSTSLLKEPENQDLTPLTIATKGPETISSTNNDNPPTPTAGSVRLKIRIGNTLSTDSIHSSPLSTAITSKPHSASITPPILTKEIAPTIKEIVNLLPESTVESTLEPTVEPTVESTLESIVESTLSNLNNESTNETGEPPRKKHKKEKKHKKDKERASLFEADGQKSEGNEKVEKVEKVEKSEKSKKRSKEHKEKKREKHSNDQPVENKSTTTPILIEEKPKSAEEILSTESLKMKFNKPIPERPSAEETNQQVKEILSAIKETQEKKNKTDSSEKSEKGDKKAKKHKKEKKHKHSKDSESSKIDRPSSSISEPQPKEITSAKPITTIKLNQTARPASQASQNFVKLFDPPVLKPEVVTKIEPKVKKLPEVVAKKDLIPESSTKKEKSTKPPTTASKGKEKSKPKDKKTQNETDEADDVVWVCPKCSVAYVDGAADMIGCDGTCNNWYHFQCVGMLKPPPENEPWYCPPCVIERRKKAKGRKKH